MKMNTEALKKKAKTTVKINIHQAQTNTGKGQEAQTDRRK